MAHDPVDGLEVGQVPLRHVHQLGGVYLVGEVGRAVFQRGRVFILVAVFLGMGTEAASLGQPRASSSRRSPGPPPFPRAVQCGRPWGLTNSSPSLSSSPLAPLSPPSRQPPLQPRPQHLSSLPKSRLHPPTSDSYPMALAVYLTLPPLSPYFSQASLDPLHPVKSSSSWPLYPYVFPSSFVPSSSHTPILHPTLSTPASPWQPLPHKQLALQHLACLKQEPKSGTSARKYLPPAALEQDKAKPVPLFLLWPLSLPITQQRGPRS